MSSTTAFVPFPAGLTPVFVVKRRNRFAVEAVFDGDRPLEVVRRDQAAHGGGEADEILSAKIRGVRERSPGDKAEPQGGRRLVLHLPNSGRMRELLTAGTPALAELDFREDRKTHGTLLVVYYNHRWVSVDARMPNRLFERCVEEQCLPQFAGYDRRQAEAAWGRGRIDFLLTSSDQKRPPLLVETKSCNLVEDGLALFPDAPTERGARHLHELIRGVRDGYRAAVVWFVQRDDATRLAPYREADPAFADAVAAARDAGVELYAYRCRVTPAGIYVLDQIPVVDA